MLTRRLTITDRLRSRPIGLVGPGDFAATPGTAIEPETIVSDPNFSLYCLDPQNNAVLFVECADPAAVDGAPFYYQAQAEHAIGLVSMPVETFHRVGRQIPYPSGNLIFVHSTGRCGSTLVSKALAGVPSVQSLSEPDDLTQMVSLRVAGVLDDTALAALIESSTRWRCKARTGAHPSHVAIKTRSEVIVLADLVARVFPDARHLFLYRNAISWMATLFRAFPMDRDPYDMTANREMANGWSRMLPLAGEFVRSGTPLNQIQIRILAWITCMEGYFVLRERSVPLAAVRFEDLTNDPIAALEGIFEFLGVEIDDWRSIEDVLSRDSQAGTIYDREERKKGKRELTEDLIQDIRELVASRPLISSTDRVLPGTILADKV
ncbi:MAG: sulfotransferase [Fimbriimonas sp.]|nr:sulfotransferase [Fimbriimonas sp.]